MPNTKKKGLYIIRDEQKRWIFRVALAFAVNGLVIVWLIFGQFPNYAFPVSLIAMCAYAAAGALVTWQLQKRDFELSVWRGVALGMVAGFIAIPLIWISIVLIFFLLRIEMPEFERVLNPIEGLILWPYITILGWATLGWITAVISGFTGGLIVYLKLRSLREPPTRTPLARVWNVIGLFLGISAIFLVIVGLVPISTRGLNSQSNLVTDYDTSIARLELLQKAESSKPLLVECQTHWMTHEQKTDKVIVIFHGLSNCPRQFYELGQIFYDAGYNVVIARFPSHVNETRNPKYLTFPAEDLRDLVDTTVDIAHGLGDHVYVMGLSGGGTAATFAAQYRSDVERVVTIAPFYGLAIVPTWLNQWGINLIPRLPNIPLPGPTTVPHAYLGMSSKSVGETIRFGEAIRRAAQDHPMLAGSLVLITNDGDLTVSNPMARALLKLWLSNGANAHEFVFDAKYGLPHDVVDIHQLTQNTEFVYPILFDLVEGRTPSLPE